MAIARQPPDGLKSAAIAYCSVGNSVALKPARNSPALSIEASPGMPARPYLAMTLTTTSTEVSAASTTVAGPSGNRFTMVLIRSIIGTRFDGVASAVPWFALATWTMRLTLNTGSVPWPASARLTSPPRLWQTMSTSSSSPSGMSSRARSAFSIGDNPRVWWSRAATRPP